MTQPRLPINNDALILGQMPRRESFGRVASPITISNINNSSLNPPSETMSFSFGRGKSREYIELVFLQLMHEAEFFEKFRNSYHAVLEKPAVVLSHIVTPVVTAASYYHYLMNSSHTDVSDTDDSDAESDSGFSDFDDGQSDGETGDSHGGGDCEVVGGDCGGALGDGGEGGDGGGGGE
jgi:hypothetical protein